MKIILTISALDPSGGAGVSADIKTAKAIGLHPCSIITALTVQNSYRVSSVHAVHPEVIKEQFIALSDDFNFSAVKIGVIPNLEIAKAVFDCIKDLECPKVLDPVLEASVGGKLGEKSAYELLMPKVSVITPNYTEAKIFGTETDPEELAMELYKKYGCSVVITGGELKGKDVVCDSGRIYTVEAELIKNSFHGTGCVYSSALACYLAMGDLEFAVRKARIFVLESVKKGQRFGKGRLFVNP
ncbi:MAG: hydroxymethylpyrimidine/phosphomethylpyrimidine kinase [Archaeoglobaceae archaeon]|nr:hydroxymethylpyrimidine/phosphomethylpyrimidine kinase [Archaeoglobaceae archaeon]MDW8118130.1 hydroxymethylpyrimidine/phosphomethylpyrimidine kinase [Archaeoglobaceae archaeon]